jgi:acyl carrier protein
VGEAPLGPSAGPLAEPWDLLRPGQTEGLIDLDPAQPVALQAATLAEALRQPGRERAVAYRGDQRYVPELPQRAEPTEPAAAPVVAAPDRKVLLAASPFERRALVEGYLRQEFASLLGTQLSDEDLDTPIQSLGLDSLMGIQMRNRVETALGVSVSLVAFLKGLPVSKLVDSITEQLTAELAGPAATCRQQAPVVVAAEGVQSLSENEVDSLLRSLLEQPPVGR